MKIYKCILVLAIFSLVLTACASTPAQLPTPETQSPSTDVPTIETGEPTLEPLPSDPQRIEFQAEDGTNLVGIYYPAAVNPAPVIVLMHWAGGDKNDWVLVGMVDWLQNRSNGTSGLFSLIPHGSVPFDTPYDFPEMPEKLSFAVFIFDFRDFGESTKVPNATFTQIVSGWLLDAKAAYSTARTLPGVNPEQMVGIGASIGADAVVDACDQGCLGALSISPGDYLGVPYGDVVHTLDGLGKPVRCVVAEDDPDSYRVCQQLEGEHFQTIIYPQGGHGMMLFHQSPDIDKPIGEVIQEHLFEVFNIAP